MFIKTFSLILCLGLYGCATSLEPTNPLEPSSNDGSNENMNSHAGINLNRAYELRRGMTCASATPSSEGEILGNLVFSETQLTYEIHHQSGCITQFQYELKNWSATTFDQRLVAIRYTNCSADFENIDATGPFRTVQVSEDQGYVKLSHLDSSRCDIIK